MSVQVLETETSTPLRKRSKSNKRKHEDVSQSPAAVVQDSQPSPTKKLKHTNPQQVADTTAATFALPDANSADKSPFTLKPLSLYLPIASISLQTPIPGLCAEHLSPLLLTYFPPLGGVVLSYSDPRLSESPEGSSEAAPAHAVSIAEYGASFVWLTVNFLVLDPAIGTPLEGWINLQSETHLGLICWNLFSATIPRNRLPEEWKWVPAGGNSDSSKRKRKDKLKGGAEVDEDVMDVDESALAYETLEDAEDHGYYLDGQGKRVRGLLTFGVVQLDAQSGFDQQNSYVSIRGTLLDADSEVKVIQEEREEWERRHSRRDKGKKRKPAYVMSGAKSMAPAEEEEESTNGTEKVKAKKKSKKEKADR